MVAKWYYAIDGARYGPATLDEVRARVADGTLRELDMVWQPAFGPEWRNIGHVRELFDPPPPPPPPDMEARQAPLTGVTGLRPSARRAASQAWSRTVATLFRPFDIGRWFSIGFCAWLAHLGAQTGNINLWGDVRSMGSAQEEFDQALAHLESLRDRPGLLALALGIVALSLLLALWMCALRSRGDFMFLHRWYRPDEPIRRCWQAARAAGRELFVWRLYVFVIVVSLAVLIGIGAYAQVIQPYLAAGKTWSGDLARLAVGYGTGAVLLALGANLTTYLAKAFVVPVMYWHGVSASRAWLALFALCNQYPFAVISFLVWGLLLGALAVLATLLFVLATCCIGVIPLALPFFSAVTLLPVYFFYRGYAVCFLSQWRRELVPADA